MNRKKNTILEVQFDCQCDYKVKMAIDHRLFGGSNGIEIMLSCISYQLKNEEKNRVRLFDQDNAIRQRFWEIERNNSNSNG